MTHHRTVLQLVAALGVSFWSMVALAENAGQADLDKATQLKVTAQRLEDLNDVIDHVDTALEKGLDDDNTEFAEQLLIASLLQRGQLFAHAVFNVPAEDPQRTLRSMQFRQFALSDLERAVSIDKHLWEAYLLIGKLQALPLGNSHAGERALTKVINGESASEEQKAEALALRSAMAEDEAKKLDDLNRAIDLQPENADYLRLRAQHLFGQEQYEKALADVDRALEIDPDHAVTHQMKGMILLGQEKYEEALASLDKATELVPDSALPYQNRGLLYHHKGDFEKAAQQLTKAIELSPQNVDALLARAGVYFELDEVEKALKDLEEVVRIQPGRAQAHIMRAEILAATDRVDEAIAHLERLLELSPGNVLILNRIGSFYLIAGRPHKAIETLSQVIEQSPDSHTAIRFRADAYLNVGDHAKAIADFERALKLGEADEGLLNNFAWVLATSPDDELRNGKRALEMATKAAELTGYETPHILSTLAAAYAETGDFEAAKKWSQKAVEFGQKAVEAAEVEEERGKRKAELEQLRKELANYEQGKPVRERQTAEDAKAQDQTAAPADAPPSPQTAEF